MTDKGSRRQWKIESEQNSNGGERNTAATQKCSGTQQVKAQQGGLKTLGQGKEGTVANTPTSSMVFEVVVASLGLSGVEQASDRAGETSLGSESKGPGQVEAKALPSSPPFLAPLQAVSDFEQNLNPAPWPLSGALA